jgi:hypothetical protein
MSDLTMRCGCGFSGRVTGVVHASDLLTIVEAWSKHPHTTLAPVSPPADPE